jgi:crossover junction endodeoxyribonuclease RuvC
MVQRLLALEVSPAPDAADALAAALCAAQHSPRLILAASGLAESRTSRRARRPRGATRAGRFVLRRVR